MDEPNPVEMDQETELLSRLAANHLHLAQFEPLRAVLLTLRRKNPGLALAILQTIVANAGRFEKIVWSSSCQSSSLLTYLSTLELLQYSDSTSRIWSFDPGTLRLRAEFLLLVQLLRDRVVDVDKGNNAGIELDELEDDNGRPADSLDGNQSPKDTSSELEDCVRVLDKVLELGIERLKPDIEADTSEDGEGRQRRVASRMIMIDESELMCLRKTILDNSDEFDALCFNIQQQMKESEVDNSGLAVMVRRDDKAELNLMEKAEEEDRKVLSLIQKVVQLAHLDAMKDWIKENNEESAVSHIRYLHLEYGVEEAEYRVVLQDLLSRVLSRREAYGESWNLMQEKLLSMYGEALSSNCTHLAEIIQVIQDDLLSQEIERSRGQDSNQIPPPLERFKRYLAEIRADATLSEQVTSLNTAASLGMRDMYHYARVSGLHVLECIMDAALSTIKKDELHEANDVLTLFPRLKPLVAAMGWDLLSGKTAGRKALMQLLWTSSESQVSRLEESSLYGDKVDEVSCVEHLCNLLCYHIDLASFVACVNSGQTWNSKSSLLLSGGQQVMPSEDTKEAFVENLVLERLSAQSPLRVLFDVVPVIKFQDAIELISMQPMSSTVESWRRMQDIELMHMRYALESVVLAITAIGRNITKDRDNNHQAALYYLKSLRTHLESVTNIPRKILMVNVIVSLLHMDDISLNLTHCASPGSMSESPSTCAWEHSDVATCEGENETVISFTELLLDILNRSLPSGVVEEITVDDELSIGGRQALEWRVSLARSFLEDWKWRLTILQSLLPLSEHHWGWKEALSVLRAAPSKLLNLCMQKAKYDIGEEAVHRFSLSAEDRATLELAEWVDGAFRRASESRLVEDAVSRAADSTSTIQDIDFTSLRSQIGALAAILLCIDVAATSARSTRMSQRLLHQAQIMLSEIYPGGSPKIGSTYLDQIHEAGVISVSRRVLKRLNELLEQDDSPGLQATLTGESVIMSSKDLLRPGQRERALAMLHQMIEDAHQGKRQFLSGKLHNLARAIADEETETSSRKGDDQETEQKVLFDFDKDGVLGLGLKVLKQIPRSGASGEPTVQPLYDIKENGKKLFGPLSPKPTTYLSQFILYIAAVGDIVDGTDTTHDFNFFSLAYEWPKDLLTRLVFDRGSTDAAAKVADIMSADFVHEVISACVPPVYPPRSGHGWARIPVSTGCSKSYSESKVLSPSSKEIKPDCNGHFSGIPTFPLYPLQLDIVKHLVKLSPVRAVLACVFGSGILYRSNDSYTSSPFSEGLLPPPDTDRVFYEFALDQSERYPTLNRWIQMQTNLHRVLEFAGSAKQKDDGGEAKGDLRTARKRVRDNDADADSEVDDLGGGRTISSSFHDIGSEDGETGVLLDSLESGDGKPDNTIYLSLDWENEELYEKAVDSLIGEGKLMEALALSDRFLRGGASDQLLQLLIERGEEIHPTSGRPQIYGGQGIWSNSWQYCLRLKNKQLAAELALKYMNRWELDAALDVLAMCSCHLTDSDSVRNEVSQRKQALQRYSHILGADDRYSNWQEVEAECKEDPEGLALRLAERGAVSAALEVAESAGLSIELRRELQGRQLVKLLTADPLNGGGPAEASRFLSSLSDSDDALPVAMGAMQLLPNLRSKQLLVHFFLKRRDGNLADVEVTRLSSWALGLRVLAALPLPWQQRCSALHEHPHLILEVLLMRKQLESAALILKEFPSLRDNSLIISYAAKAIAVSTSYPAREPRVSVSGTRQKPKTRTGAPTRSTFSSSLSNLQKEARRAFSWAPRNTGDKNPPKDVYRKRKNSGLPPSERVAWEAMAGIGEDRDPSFAGDGQERLASISIAEEWMLSGDANKDAAVRASHRYESAPDVILLKALLSLCSDESVSAKNAVELCIHQMKNVLNSQQIPENASMDVVGRAHHATKAFVQGLIYAKSLLKKPVGGSDSSKDVDDALSDAGSSGASQPIDEISQILAQADIWLGRAELLQSLLGLGIAVSLDDIADQESSAHLRDRLIADERYSMAVYTCRKCKIDVVPVWNAWGHALIRIERYEQARVKFKQALQSYKGDHTPFVLEIINTIEGGPPADVSAVRSLYEHLAKSAPMILDDSLSADSYLNVLYIPTTFPRSERSRLLEHLNDNSTTNSEIQDGPRSNLDNIRYAECVNYLQEFARPHLLGFMFRHGRYTDACMLFFPQNSVPQSLPTSGVGAATSSSSPQRLDPLATDFGTLEDLCDLSIGYGAMSVLEEVVSSRMTSAQQDEVVQQHTAAAVARICTYCETHRHFNYLYRFQVIKKDHIAAGLCCIQLFMNSSSQEEAVKHLENAKVHFDEGLSARYKGGESTKLVSKGVRGKSASEKLTEEGLVKLSARVSIQVEVVKSSNESDGPQWRRSLFGNPNDPETFRRRCEIAETLVERNFDMAFQVIYEFNLPAVDIYAGVASSLAERKKGGQLTEFFRNIKGTIDDDDWDQVLGAAINVYANKHKERPDRLIDMLTSSHRKVLACVVCGRLKSAFQIASRSGSVADVQYVAHQALHANALPVLDMCKQWLAQYM